MHEFLPSFENLLVEVTELRVQRGSDDRRSSRLRDAILHRVLQLHEQNPMLGLRVCRLGILYPGNLRDASTGHLRSGVRAEAREVSTLAPTVMIPGVGTQEEMQTTRDAAKHVADEVLANAASTFAYRIGTMIELPRACIVADELAEYAEFFSFGTNDLTQTTYGYSRDDAEASFIPVYLEKRILKDDPFQVLDRDGVGGLMERAVESWARRSVPDLKIGICGEHGGEPSSIAFCERLGLDYVSCSPYRVPIARLAAAQAAIGSLD